MNGPTSIDNIAPRLEINPDASPANKELLEKLKLGISKSPELYAAIFEINLEFPNNGVERFKAVNDYLHERPADTEQEPNASDQWRLFLNKLPGEFTIANDYRFDPVTTDAIRNYGPIRELLETIEGDISYSARKELKEKVKIEQLRYFLGRAVASRAAQVDLVHNRSTDNNAYDKPA